MTPLATGGTNAQFVATRDARAQCICPCVSIWGVQLQRLSPCTVGNRGGNAFGAKGQEKCALHLATGYHVGVCILRALQVLQNLGKGDAERKY